MAVLKFTYKQQVSLALNSQLQSMKQRKLAVCKPIHLTYSNKQDIALSTMQTTTACNKLGAVGQQDGGAGERSWSHWYIQAFALLSLFTANSQPSNTNLRVLLATSWAGSSHLSRYLVGPQRRPSITYTWYLWPSSIAFLNSQVDMGNQVLNRKPDPLASTCIC